VRSRIAAATPLDYANTSLPESPKAIKAVISFAQKAMQVKDVRISPGLNQAIWARGVRSPPTRVRVRLERKRNDDEGAKEKLYVLASVVEGVTSFKVSVGRGWVSGYERRSRVRVMRARLSARETGEYVIGVRAV
jgi:ribosomal protein L31E